ncbi:histidine phosphatase superfamily [Lineolata rhizophorae]|uniref:Histidine phosphatase superfamily n=1 Tax=Lineolata rhizophorae TaxID=578093 RepID=A0A6A6PBF8_9PEZI|nr:histidine phosphatase superfamily [Lineolata rhizophorae]
MLAFFVALLAAVILAPTAAEPGKRQVDYHNVRASVVYTVAGEATPASLGSFGPQHLTSLGAQQLFAAGSFFRQRYLVNDDDGPTDGTTDEAYRPIAGLSADIVNDDHLYALTTDDQPNVASAQAFLQGLYPPFEIAGSDAAATATQLDPSSVLSNGSYVSSPLDGYRYPRIRAASTLDPAYASVAGNRQCGAWAASAQVHLASEAFTEVANAAADLYYDVGTALLYDVLDDSGWDYINAVPIWDYLSYMYNHNSTVMSLLSSNISFPGALDQVRDLASRREWAINADLAYSSVATGAQVGEQIRAVAGKTLAAKVLGLFSEAIASGGDTNKLNLLFGDHAPLTAFFGLARMQQADADFYGLPEPGSSLVFDLFTTDDAADAPFPTSDEADSLKVRVYFRNGTAPTADPDDDGIRDVQNSVLTARTLFGNYAVDFAWDDFGRDMAAVMTPSAAHWCAACGGTALFCPAFSYAGLADDEEARRTDGCVSPPVAGVIGVVVTLVVLAIVAALLALLLGVRVRRVPPPPPAAAKKSFGGFKGDAKMASDADLALPKGGAPAGAGAPAPRGPLGDVKGHERVGSWELSGPGDKDVEGGGPGADAGAMGMSMGVGRAGLERRRSEESLEVSPYAEPVRPEERV